jgi:UDP-galactose transporter B1
MRFSHPPLALPYVVSWFLVLIQVSGNIAFSGLVLAITRPPSIHVSSMTFLKMSLSYISAMLLSNWALSYISYPLQSLIKSSKLIPVMLMRLFINQARYELREYVQVGLITSGIYVFMAWADGDAGHAGPISSAKWLGSIDMSWIGLLLCILALVLDGYTGPVQERVCSEHKCSMAQLMFYLNVYSLLPLLSLLLATGELWTGFRFTQSNPLFLMEATAFSLCSALGQSVVLFTLLTFNSLILVTVTTTRKFATILLSVFIYGHRLQFMQWTGVGLVFAGLWMDVHGAYRKHTGAGKVGGAAPDSSWLDGKKQDGEMTGEDDDGAADTSRLIADDGSTPTARGNGDMEKGG